MMATNQNFDYDALNSINSMDPEFDNMLNEVEELWDETNETDDQKHNILDDIPDWNTFLNQVDAQYEPQNSLTFLCKNALKNNQNIRSYLWIHSKQWFFENRCIWINQ